MDAVRALASLLVRSLRQMGLRNVPSNTETIVRLKVSYARACGDATQSICTSPQQNTTCEPLSH